MMRRLSRNRSGAFSFIELIISMTLIAVVAVTSIQFIAQFHKLAMMPAKANSAATYAVSKMEEIYMNPITSWSNGSNVPYSGMNASWSHSSAPVNGYYLMNVSIDY